MIRAKILKVKEEKADFEIPCSFHKTPHKVHLSKGDVFDRVTHYEVCWEPSHSVHQEQCTARVEAAPRSDSRNCKEGEEMNHTELRLYALELIERSKLDNEIIVGSEVRVLGRAVVDLLDELAEYKQAEKESECAHVWSSREPFECTNCGYEETIQEEADRITDCS